MFVTRNDNESLFDFSCKYGLALLLFFLPVHRYLASFVEQKLSIGLTNPLYLLLIFSHEIILIVLLPYVLIKLFTERNLYLIVFFCAILFLSCIGFLSGIINNNEILRTLGGTYLYVKSFLFILLYGTFFKKKEDVRNLYHAVRFFALIIAVIAVFHETFYIIMHYIFHFDFAWRNFPFKILSFRYGLAQVTSLLRHHNLLGLFLLLFLMLELSLREKGYLKRAALFSLGILCSLGKMVYMGFALVVFLTAKSKKLRLVFIMLFICFSLIVFVKSDKTRREIAYLTQSNMDSQSLQNIRNNNFRFYCRDIALSIFLDNPYIGSGPGTFGNAFSFILPSTLYDEYFDSDYWRSFMTKQRSIDQFWTQCLAEIGIIGIICMLIFILLCFYILWIAQKKCSDPWLKHWLFGCSLGPLIIMIYTMGSGINMTEFIVPFAAFSGMGLGTMNNK